MTNVEVVFLNICVFSFAHCLSIYNNKTQVNLSDYQQTDGEMYMNTMKYDSSIKEEWNPIICDTMVKPESIMLSEISQAQNYHMVSTYVDS